MFLSLNRFLQSSEQPSSIFLSLMTYSATPWHPKLSMQRRIVYVGETTNFGSFLMAQVSTMLVDLSFVTQNALDLSNPSAS